MVLGVVSADVSKEALAFARQSFFDKDLIASIVSGSPKGKEVYDACLKGIAKNVKTQPGGFKATSGVVLPYYLNLSTNFMDPDVATPLLWLVSECLMRIHAKVASSPDEKIALVGMEVAGGMMVSQLAVCASEEVKKRYDFVYMRKNKKSTGTAQQLEGMTKFTSRTPTSEALKTIWIDDVNSTGSSLCEGIATLKADYNMDVVSALYLVDRSKDRQNLEPTRQKLSDDQFVAKTTTIHAIMELDDIDKFVVLPTA